METITIHPRTKEETNLFENLAKALKTPYTISHKERVGSEKKKPSDFLGTLSKAEGEKMLQYIRQSRQEWTRNI